MTRRLLYIAGGCLVLFALGLGTAATLGWFGSSRPEINPDDPVQVALGRETYFEHCARCHGTNLEGEANWRERKPNGRLPAPPHDASGHTWHHPDQQLLTIVKSGLSAVLPSYESDMPAFADTLSDEQIRSVLAFIKSTWPTDIKERQNALNRAR